MAVDAAASDLHVVATGAADFPIASHLKSHDKSHSCLHGALLSLPKGKTRMQFSLYYSLDTKNRRSDLHYQPPPAFPAS